MASDTKRSLRTRLKRDLGTIESYAVLIGMLVGAGIFRVTGVASGYTGAGVIVGYLLLAPAILATSIGYVVFLSTSLGESPAGEYANLRATFGGPRLAFICAWLKLISYLGALAYLARALADYCLQLAREVVGTDFGLATEFASTGLALALLVFFLFIHASGVRWFGRVQVAMCAVLGLSIVVLVVPGVFFIEKSNLQVLFPSGSEGFLRALPPLFFAFAGFECLAHSAGEVRESTERLPRVFLRGIALTTLIFIAMSVVAFGVLSPDELAASKAPMADVAQAFLPAGASALVTLGGVLAVATSVNGTMLVPARMAAVLAEDELLPAWVGEVHEKSGTPRRALFLSFAVAAALLVSGQLALALNIAVFALVVVYLLNSLALLCLPKLNPALYAEAKTGVSLRVQRIAGTVSVLSMAALIVVQLIADADNISSSSFSERFHSGSLTCIELFALWTGLGLTVFWGMQLAKRRKTQSRA